MLKKLKRIDELDDGAEPDAPAVLATGDDLSPLFEETAPAETGVVLFGDGVTAPPKGDLFKETFQYDANAGLLSMKLGTVLNGVGRDGLYHAGHYAFDPARADGAFVMDGSGHVTGWADMTPQLVHELDLLI